ncbi:putative endonuclease 4 [Bryobacterales bacterium F-183]|nr:putative endonuclease 4 [Bryobacterales bacterium F-183]
MALAPRLGLHTSTAGGLDNAAHEALAVGADCLQIFSSSPRTWKANPVDAVRAKTFRLLRDKHGLAPLAIHCNYLINLASTDATVLENSVRSLRGEIERAIAIEADYLVLHPGSKKNHPDAETAIQFAAAAIHTAARGLRFGKLKILFENTAGAGQSIGSSFEELALLTNLIAQLGPLPSGYCIDTCHCYAAGYDVSTQVGLSETVRQLDSILGLENIPMFHANDSKGGLGSHMDRHANIGFGQIGSEGFRRILTHPQLAPGKAFILETPMDDGWAQRDLDALRALAGA